MKKRTATIILAFIAWFTLVLQFCLMLINPDPSGFSPVMRIINYFSYFTILSNVLVAACLTFPWLLPHTPAGRFFSKVSVQSAIAVYIFIVGLVYNLVLRQIWSPTGWQWVADNLLHVLVPLAFIPYWYFYNARNQLQWKNIPAWLIFPAIYLIYSLLRGASTGWYPYPFLNAAQYGYGKVAVNSLLVLLAFIITSAAVVAVNRSAAKGSKS